MLNKYFGFLNIQDEYSVIESLLEHTRIDEEEIALLSSMINHLCENNLDKIEPDYSKIRQISMESSRIFESTAEQIVQAQFDHQKQYDLLRLYQRIESISGLMISSAKRILILFRIGGSMPPECVDGLKMLMESVVDIHNEFKKALKNYLEDKKTVLELIKIIEEKEHFIDHIRSDCLKTLYQLGNQDKLKMGTFRAIENIVEHLEDVSDSVEAAAKSLEWLLI